MRAYVSLHTEKPSSQLDNEVYYQGYERMEVELDESFYNIHIDLFFPVIEADSDDVVTYVAIGAEKKGQGEIFLRIPSLPNIVLKDEPIRRTKEFWLGNGYTPEQADKMIVDHGYIAPRVAICNSDEVTLPDNLNPIARVAHRLVYAGLIHPADLHPKLYEAINDALHNAGVPVIPVNRGGAANLKPTGGWTLGDFGNVEGNA